MSEHRGLDHAGVMRECVQEVHFCIDDYGPPIDPDASSEDRSSKIRIAVEHLIKSGHIAPGQRNGAQRLLADHFGVTRQRVAQIVREQRRRAAP